MRLRRFIVTAAAAIGLGLSVMTPMAAQAAKNTTQSMASINPGLWATNVPVTVRPTATWKQNITPSTLAWTFKTGGTTVPATMSYNSTTFTVTIKPSAVLNTATQYDITMKTPSSVLYSWSFTTVPPPPVVLNNNCSAGYVTFTFDDGPGPTANYPGDSLAMVKQLQAEHIPAVFFLIGANVVQNPSVVRTEVADGFLVENHTYDHLSLTGESTGTSPLTDAQVTSELSSDNAAIVAAGGPQPTLWRPPYGDVNANDNLLASQLGLRIVMDWGYTGSNIVDSQDWTGISSSQIVNDVTQGYTLYGATVPGISNGSIIAMHDASGYSINTIGALPGIVTYMNAHSLCATSTVRPDATGGVVPNYGGTTGQAQTQTPSRQIPQHRPPGHTGA